ncbi:CDP-glycerol glycerophosphotransferase family protein [Thalassotalea atypica]|uniref:CDP-glycerol glycerophosphotransferase family protein n=1 Tax=Thalassotalea atypica TaxID=2054316 RepID=UPI00257352D3|nr:CDP-glycerol glycerophosphotransferase family protein [Thalassotalea atypica]
MKKNYLFYISENYSFQILRPLQKEILARGDEVKWYVAGSKVNVDYFNKDESVVGSIEDCVDYNPVAVFVPGNMVPSFIPGIKVSVFHGFVGWKTRQKDNVNYHFIIRDCFDLYCTHGPTSTAPFKQLEHKHKNFSVVETGWCKMDPYFKETPKQRAEKKKKIVLFSSTFSPRLTQAPALKEKIMALSEQGKYHWLITFHPKMSAEIVESYKAIQHDNLTFIETDNLVPYMQQADVMLGDYSSMITDFLVLGKPAVTFNNDGFITGLKNVESIDELESAIDDALTYPDEMMNVINRYASAAHPYRDGQSSSRVLEAVDSFLNYNPVSKRKPLNLIRNLKARKSLNYWRL